MRTVWLWPNRVSPSSALVRMGRLLHWLATGTGVLIAIIGFCIVFGQIRSRPASLRAGAEWDQRHPAGISGDQEIYDYRPIEVTVEPGIALACAACGFGLSLAGRGLRYILADE